MYKKLTPLHCFIHDLFLIIVNMAFYVVMGDCTMHGENYVQFYNYHILCATLCYKQIFM